MKQYTFLLLPLFVLAFFTAYGQSVSAMIADPVTATPVPVFIPAGNATSTVSEAVSPVSCFDYYHFQSVQVAMGLSRDTYQAGDTLTFSGYIENQNSYPIVDGTLFVRLARENKNYVQQGHFIVDEIIPLSGITLDAHQKKNISFSWTAPTSLVAGAYRADYFYSIGKKFNLGGLPFSNEVIVGMTRFSLHSSTTAELSFDRSGTTVNGEPYFQIGNWPVVPSAKPVVIKHVLKNTGDQAVKATISYTLSFWDSLNPADTLSEKTESVTVPAHGSVALTYTIPSATETVYYLKTQATVGGEKSIINARILTDGERPRLNYPGITAFPLVSGQKASLFSCFHNTSGNETSGTVSATLSDVSGNIVATMSYKGVIPSEMFANATAFTAKANYTYLKLQASVLDKNGREVDHYESVYDCAVLRSASCAKVIADADTSTRVKGMIALIGGIVVAILAFVALKKKPSLLTVLLCVGALSGVTFNHAEAYAQRSAQTNLDYIHGWNRMQVGLNEYHSTSVAKACNGDGFPNRYIASGNVSVIHYIDMTQGSTTASANDTIAFQYNPANPYFTASGGSWDTPYGSWGSSFTTTDIATLVNDNKGLKVGTSNNPGYIYWTAVKPTQAPSGAPSDQVYISSSDSSVVSCSGMNCVAHSGGTVTLTAHVPAVTAKIWSVIKRRVDTANHSSNYGLTPNEPFYFNDTMSSAWIWESDSRSFLKTGDTSWSNDKTSLASDACAVQPQTNTMQLPATTMTWTVTVTGPAALPGVSLSANPTQVVSGATTNLSWTTTNSPSSCVASGGWSGSKNPSGDFETSPALSSPTTFTLVCQKVLAGVTYYATSSATVTIGSDSSGGSGGIPTVDIKANGGDGASDGPISVDSGSNVSLTWVTANNPTSCVASGGSPGWTGSHATSSASWDILSVTSAYPYIISCGNSYGTTSDTVSVNINNHICALGGYWPNCNTVDDVIVTVNPSVVQKGGKCQLSWSVTGFDLCYLSGGRFGSNPGVKIDLSSSNTATTTATMDTLAPVIYTFSCGKSPYIATTTRSATCSVVNSFQEQ